MGIVMRGPYVALSFVLCAVVTVGCWPLHSLLPSTDELSVPVSSSSLQELSMGGFLSRSRRREVNEETSPRLESEAEVKPDQNQLEVNRHKKQVAESQSNSDEITGGVDPIEACESSECAALVRNSPDVMPVDDISLAVDADQGLPHGPASEGEVLDVNIEEEDSNRDMRSSPSHPDVIQEPVSNDNENVVNVDVSREQPNPETSLRNMDEQPESLHNVEGPVLPQTLCNYRQEEVEDKLEAPESDRDVRSPQIVPFMIPEQILIDEDADVIVDVSSEEFHPAFDPSIHFMAEPVIFHPQPLPVEDVIDLDIDDELVRKRRTFENACSVHPESKETQPGPDDE